MIATLAGEVITIYLQQIGYLKEYARALFPDGGLLEIGYHIGRESYYYEHVVWDSTKHPAGAPGVWHGVPIVFLEANSFVEAVTETEKAFPGCKFVWDEEEDYNEDATA